MQLNFLSLYWHSLLVLAVAVSSCTSKSVTSTQPYSVEYHWKSQSYHPVIAVSNRNADSVEYSFVFPASDFGGDVKNQLVVCADYSPLFPDSMRCKRFAQCYSEKGDTYKGKFYLPTDSLVQHIELIFYSTLSSKSTKVNLPFMPRAEGPVWTPEHGTGQLTITQPIQTIGNVSWKKIPRYEKLPTPPFASNYPAWSGNFIYGQGNIETPASGLYYFTTAFETIALHVHDRTENTSFPLINYQADLYAPMRYMCSKEEYDKIAKSYQGAKNEMEKFWKNACGSKDKARDLMELYFSRVEDANRQFTTYADGWKTDRGMVYIIFGHPFYIVRENNKEIWYYGKPESINTLKFEFKLINDPLYGTVHQLQRGEQYRDVWEQQVTLWRQGKIYP
jgi:GWxTD domain-containing protein